jgi:hypothetical protein
VTPGERICDLGVEFERNIDADAGQHLEARQRVAGGGAQQGEELDCSIKVADGGEGGDDLDRPRKQAKDGAGHDPQRALRAHEEMLQGIAGVVLAQPAQPVPRPAVGEHDLEAEDEVAHIAVTQHGRAAGVGRDVAADRARSLRADAQREEPVHLDRRGLDLGEDHAGVDRDRVVGRVYVTMRFIRFRLSRTSPRGIAPATEPVLPPWGTIGAPAATQALTIAATSSVLLGMTMIGVAPSA